MAAAPLPAQDYLLQAAFLETSASLQAWSSWKACTDLEAALDPGSFRLLPFAMRNLQRQGLDDPFFPKLKGISQQNWTRNQILLRQLQEFSSVLKENGIEAMALGSLALVLQGITDLSLYPANSCTLLVAASQARPAVELASRSWQLPPGLNLENAESLVSKHSGYWFYSPQGWKLHMLWRLAGSLDQPGRLAELWKQSGSSGDGQLLFSLPNPADQVILVTKIEPYPARFSFFRQAVELLLLLQLHSGALDWSSLAESIQELGLAPLFRSLAIYLDDRLQLSRRYPDLKYLRELNVSRLHQLSTDLDWRQWASLESFPYAWFEFWQKSYRLSRLEKLAGFTRLLRKTWRMRYLWLAPWFLLSALLLRWQQR